MKKLVFTMDDFGIHESISYLLRDILRDKIQRMYDENVAGLENEIKLLHAISVEDGERVKDAERRTLLAEHAFSNFRDSLQQSQGGTLDSGRVDSPTESNGEVRDIPDQN